MPFCRHVFHVSTLTSSLMRSVKCQVIIQRLGEDEATKVAVMQVRWGLGSVLCRPSVPCDSKKKFVLFVKCDV